MYTHSTKRDKKAGLVIEYVIRILIISKTTVKVSPLLN